MPKKLLLIIIMIIMTCIVLLSDTYQYTGETKCKICHIKQYRSWQQTKHAKAFDVLKPEEQKKEECIKCHITGYKEDGEILKNVQCEACHGPGNMYKDIEIMKNRAKAISLGLIIPNEETCIKCHNENSPLFKEFNYEEAKKSGVHDIIEK